MATTAGTWEELLETVVDETRDALRASVSSLYLLDRDSENLTLAATNGLDRYQIGRAQVPFGGGVTGRVAATREPLVIPDISHDDRFLWVRGIDQRRFIASMLSVPLVWNDRTVGVLNVQTEQARDFTSSDVAHLRAIADLLAGHRREGPDPEGGRGPRDRAEGDRRGARRADRDGHARAPDAARGRPCLHGAARRGAAARGPRIARHGAARSSRRLVPLDDGPGRPPGSAGRLDSRLRAGRLRARRGPRPDRRRRRSSARPPPSSRRCSPATGSSSRPASACSP